MRQFLPWSSLEDTRKSNGNPCWKFLTKKTVGVLSLGLANTFVKHEPVAASCVVEVTQVNENEWVWPGSHRAFLLYINISIQYNFTCHTMLFFLWCFSYWKFKSYLTHVFYKNQAGLWFADLCSKPFWLGRSVATGGNWTNSPSWRWLKMMYRALRKPFEFIAAMLVCERHRWGELDWVRMEKIRETRDV